MWAASSAAASSCSRSYSMSRGYRCGGSGKRRATAAGGSGKRPATDAAGGANAGLPLWGVVQGPTHECGEIGRRQRVDGERPGVGRAGEAALVAQHAERHAALGEGAEDPAVE